ncbi:FAD-dependent oxidoreductase [Myxococcota bacterium]|nr:FAD-dependent oxidoreductase [Myxococcota bacterium]
MTTSTAIADQGTTNAPELPALPALPARAARDADALEALLFDEAAELDRTFELDRDAEGDRPGLDLAEQTLVVAGNGMAGWRLCQRLVDCGAHGALKIVVFGEEPRPAYDRVHLTELFQGKTPDALTLASVDWYVEHGIELHLGDPIVEIDREHCVVVAASGLEVPYDRLVLATGSRPAVPSIEGIELPGIFVYRTIEDLESIRAYAARSRRAAVIGGGLLGLEAAKALVDLGLSEVHVLQAGPRLMPRQLDDAAASLVRAHVESLGPKVHVNAETRSIRALPDADDGLPSSLVLDLGALGTLEVELVVVSAGIVPRAELAQAAGLTLGEGGAVAVDAHLQTSDDRIFAIGECAAYRGRPQGFVLPGNKMVDVLVDNLAGGEATYETPELSAKLKLLGITVVSLGLFDEAALAGATAEVHQAPGKYRKLVVHEGKIVGAIVVGDWDNLDRLQEIITQPKKLSFWDLRRFRSTGDLWLKSESEPVTEWPAEAIVCGCMQVTKGALCQVISDGHATLDAVCAKTRAGSMCGSCKPLVAELLGERRPSMQPEDLAHVADLAALPPLPPLVPRRGLHVVTDAELSAELPALPRPPVAPPRPKLNTVVPLLEAPPVAARTSVVPGVIPLRPHTLSPRPGRASLPPLRPLTLSPTPESPTAGRLSSLPAPRAEPSRLPPEPGAKPLAIAAALGVVGWLTLVLAPPLPAPTSITETSLLSWLSTDDVGRQVSGYSVVALALASLLVSLRKRVPAFAAKDVAFFRVVHGILGSLSLGMLAVHTGFELGQNLNRVLMFDFLAVSLFGAFAGIVTAIAHRWTARTARDQRRRWTGVHVALAWPLPVLVVLHVIAAYFY